MQRPLCSGKYKRNPVEKNSQGCQERMYAPNFDAFHAAMDEEKDIIYKKPNEAKDNAFISIDEN